MTNRSLCFWVPTVAAGLAIALVGVVAYSALLLVRTVAAVGLSVLELALNDLATYLRMVVVFEVAAAAIVWATRGPVLAIAWVAARASAWRGE